jgi:hypothetical protein
VRRRGEGRDTAELLGEDDRPQNDYIFHLLRAGSVTGERLSSMCGRNGSKALEFALTHLDLLSAFESNAPSSPLYERNTITIQALVDTSNTAGSAGNGNTLALALDFSLQFLLVTLAEVLDDSSLHGEFHTVKWEEPNEVPYPDNSDPSAGDACDLREWPVTESSDDGGDELGDTEGNEERIGWPFHEEEAVRASDEDEGLRDDGDLEVDDHVNDRIIGVLFRAPGIAQ